MSVAGTYDCTIKTPMGPQNAQLTVAPTGSDSFTGTIGGDMGQMEIEDGTVAGQTISWKMKMTKPMPMNLDCEATIDGDTLTGKIKTGMFGAMDLTGTRRG
jgi:hypothetical protein